MVTRGDVGLVLGLCGFLLGGYGAYLGFRAYDQARLTQELVQDGDEMLAGLGGKVKELGDDVKSANARISALAHELAERKEAETALAARLSEIETKLPK